MGYLFAQTWIWIAVAFVLGLAIGFGLAWVSRRKKIEVTQERITGTPAEGPTPLYVGDGRLAGTLGAATRSSTGGRHAAPDPDETIRRTPAQQGDTGRRRTRRGRRRRALVHLSARAQATTAATSRAATDPRRARSRSPRPPHACRCG